MRDRPIILVDFDGIVDVESALGGDARIVRRSAIPDVSRFCEQCGERVRIIAVLGNTPIERGLVPRLPRLALIAALGAGYEGVDLDEARHHRVQVSHGRGMNSSDVADHALALFLALLRNVVRGDQLIRSGGWVHTAPLPRTRSASEMRAGIVGLGEIGGALAKRLQPLVGSLEWWGPREKPEASWPRVGSLEALAERSDVLFITARLSPATEGLVGIPILSALGANGLLVNVSRGGVVAEAALLSALDEGRIGGAALDVFVREPTDSALWTGRDNVVVTPHIAGWTTAAIARIQDLFFANIRAVLNGGRPITPVH